MLCVRGLSTWDGLGCHRSCPQGLRRYQLPLRGRVGWLVLVLVKAFEGLAVFGGPVASLHHRVGWVGQHQRDDALSSLCLHAISLGEADRSQKSRQGRAAPKR